MDKLLKSVTELNKCGVRDAQSAPISLYWLRATGSELDRYVITPRGHHHTFFEMHFILSGSVVYRTENEDITLDSGDVVLFSPGMRHRLIKHSKSFIKLTAAFGVGEDEPLFDALIKKSGKAVINNAGIKGNVEFILSEAKNAGCYQAFLIKNRILESVCLLAGSIPVKKQSHSVEDAVDERVIRAKHYINDNTSLFLTCSDVAAYCHISPKQLGRLFARYEGVSLLKYIHEIKIISAKKMLSSSGMTVSRISAELGFSDEYYFNNFFKKHVGMTPGDYRKAAMDNPV